MRVNLNVGIVWFLCAAAVSCRKAPVFSRSYIVFGSLNIPYAELSEPFQAWFDNETFPGISRIDYYQGTVKTYQLGDSNTGGKTLEIVPITTESSTNVATCFLNRGTLVNPVVAQSILPDITNFKFVGTEVQNGYQCDIWRETVKTLSRTSTYTIWIRWQKNPKSPSLSEPIPVRYEMKGFNSLIGSHYDHYYLDYDNFVVGKPDPALFKQPQNLNCGSSNGAHDHHVYNFNPMKELVDRHTDHVDEAWQKYKDVHSKSYDTTEHDQRKHIFTHNLRFIHSTNRKGLGYTLSVNHLADRSEEELKAYRGGRYNPASNNGASEFPYNSVTLNKLAANLPQNFDWRIRGAVTPVKDQVTCGSCWSFAAVGAMEGAYFLKTGQLVRFSEQALVDCSWGFGNNGCDGGADTQSYQWIQKHGGIPTDQQYGSYLGQDGYCHTDTVELMAPITGFVNVAPNNETALRVALYNHGPISVFIDAAHKSFSFYSNGVFFEPTCKNNAEGLDHVVLVVGYGTLDGEDYWLIKNSWSNHWGDQGYVLMSTKDNNCGVMTTPSYVTM